MNWKTWIPLAFAVALALVAAKLTHNVISNKKTGGNAPGDFVQVVVARGDIAPGTPLTNENLTLAPMPGKVAPPSSYTATGDLEGRVATQQLMTGQPINEKLLAPKGQGIGLQAMIPQGLRAVTIEVNEFTGLAGLVAPGMNVDVVGTFRDDSTRETTARTVVQNLKVIAVGPRMVPAQGEEQKEMYKSVTLLASPKDAEKVELSAYSGRPRLSLRSGRDNAIAQLKGAALSELASGNTDNNSPGSNLVVALLKKAAARASATTRPVHMVEVDPSAKVKPVIEDADPFGEAAPTNRRTIEVIRNGVKSSVIFETPRPARNNRELMTDTSIEPVIGGGK
jgi:pilus assembly protein CpaB